VSDYKQEAHTVVFYSEICINVRFHLSFQTGNVKDWKWRCGTWLQKPKHKNSSRNILAEKKPLRYLKEDMHDVLRIGAKHRK